MGLINKKCCCEPQGVTNIDTFVDNCKFTANPGDTIYLVNNTNSSIILLVDTNPDSRCEPANQNTSSKNKNILSLHVLNLCTIESPTNGRFTSDKGNSYHALEMCEGVNNENNQKVGDKNEKNDDENEFKLVKLDGTNDIQAIILSDTFEENK